MAWGWLTSPWGDSSLTCSAGPGKRSKCRCGHRGCRAAGAGAAAPRATPGRGIGTQPAWKIRKKCHLPTAPGRVAGSRLLVTGLGTKGAAVPTPPGRAEPCSPTRGKERNCSLGNAPSWATPTQLQIKVVISCKRRLQAISRNKSIPGQRRSSRTQRDFPGRGAAALGKEWQGVRRGAAGNEAAGNEAARCSRSPRGRQIAIRKPVHALLS